MTPFRPVLITTVVIFIILLVTTVSGAIFYSVYVETLKPAVEDPAQAPSDLKLSISERESFCLGETMVIEWNWKGAEEVEYVSLLLREPRSDTQLGDYPLGFVDGERTGGKKGRLIWTVGRLPNEITPAEGFLYRIGIQGVFKSSAQVSGPRPFTQSELFAIQHCPQGVPTNAAPVEPSRSESFFQRTFKRLRDLL